jgi:dTDP-4-dehydrorhamnose reductase
MHRILITGSNGLLGQKLVHLLRSNSEVELLATSTGANRISSEEGYSYQSLDISNREAVLSICKVFKPTAIVNTAAITLVDLCETEQELCQLVNVTAVGYLLEAARAEQAHLLQVSTDFVFNGQAGPYRETDTPDPLSVYSRSKFDAECLLAASEYTNWSIARTMIIYGVGENMSRSNIVLWARKALRDSQDMNVVGDQFRSPTLAEDLAEGCWLILKHNAKGVYHLSGPETMSILEMVYAIAAYYGFDVSKVKEIDTASLGQPAARPPRTGFIIDKARAILGYSPRTLIQGLELIDKQSPIGKA